jgi:hypothetical protein
MLSESLNLLMKGVIKKKKNYKVVSTENEEKPKEEAYHPLPFDREKVYGVIQDAIEGYFHDKKHRRYKYVKADNALICQKLSQQIKEELKTWPNLARYLGFKKNLHIGSLQSINYHSKNFQTPYNFSCFND